MNNKEWWYNLRRDLRDDLHDLKYRRWTFDDYAALAAVVATNIYAWFVVYPKLLHAYCP